MSTECPCRRSSSPAPWGRGRSRSYGYGRDLHSWYQYELPLGGPPAVRGDNVIGFRVLEAAPRISFDMSVEEVEVEVGGRC
jgi:hypothetical protein